MQQSQAISTPLPVTARPGRRGGGASFGDRVFEALCRGAGLLVLVLLGALIPVSNAVRDTGGTDLVAGWLSQVAQGLPPTAALALVLVAALAVTPFLNNAATVLMLGPIAAGTAGKLGLNPDPFLMAVALGAASDFLTPIGHQCNTLVMGPGGYRFGDYWRLGTVLAALFLAVAVLYVPLVWPF